MKKTVGIPSEESEVSLPWFRFYSEVLQDRKVQELTSAMFKRWVNLLCLANRGTPRGRIGSVEQVAFELRCSRPDAESLMHILVNRQLMDPLEGGGWIPHKWHDRQFASDSPSVRMRRFRFREKARTVRAQKAWSDSAHVTPNETVSEVQSTESTVSTPGSEGSAVVTQPLTAKDQVRARGSEVVTGLVDDFRAISGQKSPKDGDVLASLVRVHGEKTVRAALMAGPMAAMLKAADSPLLYFARQFSRGKSGKTRPSLAEDQAQILRDIGAKP